MNLEIMTHKVSKNILTNFGQMLILWVGKVKYYISLIWTHIFNEPKCVALHGFFVVMFAYKPQYYYSLTQQTCVASTAHVILMEIKT